VRAVKSHPHHRYTGGGRHSVVTYGRRELTERLIVGRGDSNTAIVVNDQQDKCSVRELLF
jgi:hypothetical protein